MIAKVHTVAYYELHNDILLFNILGHFSGIFEDNIYACDLLEGTMEKDWVEINPFKVIKAPKWCSKIWFLLHIR